MHINYTHKTLRVEGNDLYKNPEEYLTNQGFVMTSKHDASALIFVRGSNDSRVVVHVVNGKPRDHVTGFKARYLAFEGDPTAVASFINDLEKLVLPIEDGV